MELLQLQYFRAIATCGSMSRAAQMLYVSQPTLSITMTRLEESLGFSLFLRQKGKLALTEEGREFLACVERVLSDLDGSVNSIRSLSRGEETSIRVVASLSDMLGVVMAQHCDEFRHLRIYQQFCDNENIARLMEEKRADWGIVHGSAHTMRFENTLLHRCPRIFVMREGHPLLKYDRLPAEELPNLSYVCNRARDELDVLTMLGKRHHFTPQVESECDDDILEAHILNATGCVATMPGLALIKLLRNPVCKPLCYLLPDFELPDVQLYVIRRRELLPGAYAGKLISYIQRFLKEENKTLEWFFETGEVKPLGG